jgi:ubiquinone/menaquinone biosynthesis C-methylase UbiE
MSAQGHPVSESKQQQRADWDSASAGWKRWWPVFERAAQHVSNRLVEMAGVRPGSRVADLATGIGEPAVTAARKVGNSGRVVAIDHSQGMLAVARERAAALGLGNLDFAVGDIESLEAEPHSFDAAVCRWGLMFVPELESAARGIRQALKPGGRFATAVWSTPDKVPMISLGSEAVRALAGLPARQPGALDPFRLADISILKRALEKAGFTEIVSEQIEVVFEFSSADEFTRFRTDVSSPFRAVLDKTTPELREKILRATTEAAKHYCLGDGSLRLSNAAICVAARA